MKSKEKPLRMCVACRTRVPKEKLFRVVKNTLGEIFLDGIQKEQLRGVYICRSIECVEKAKKTRALNRSFQCNIDENIYEELKREIHKFE